MAKNIMFQGTGSTVGKSVITAALCRILNDEGYKVAPFKSQNMALNAYVTKEGKEMGRAQVVQAEAARIEPHVSMNPILLKPTSDMGSQVIVNGEVYMNLSASDYYSHKEKLMTEVKKAYKILDEAYEIIVVEGAGSPAEINLRKNDIVNMGLAEEIDTPVILIGDIDKGGVFASIYGTYMLLSLSEQKRIKGYIINKFRGDVTLLEPGIEMFYERLPIPCLGVIPFETINVDDEDSVTERFLSRNTSPIQIGVVRLPYLSNFTDFTPFELEPDVGVQYISTQEDFEKSDLIILPGSKSTIKDLDYIKSLKMDQWIKEAHGQGKTIIGICGGYQMLGQEIKDPLHVETNRDYIDGIGLLEMTTTMMPNKTTVQSEGEVLNCPTGLQGKNHKVKGYEIHMGVSTYSKNMRPFLKLNDRLDGCMNREGTVYGTYLHGLFDMDSFRHGLLTAIRTKKVMEQQDIMNFAGLKEEAYDHLAKLVKQNLDMDKIKAIVGII
ncbi:MAG: cobyric acid synthase CobQ [Firmicutes bacterium HGW-Firmicutes-3]|nr:MAG: cobyric acid synthase CobQ [Firmicutes bacterium HGW-Firmicutes-3]